MSNNWEELIRNDCDDYWVNLCDNIIIGIKIWKHPKTCYTIYAINSNEKIYLWRMNIDDEDNINIENVKKEAVNIHTKWVNDNISEYKKSIFMLEDQLAKLLSLI
jgi:uncharacterized protein YmfQ (DUF2313 family)